MCTAIPTPPGVTPGPSIPCGKATASRDGARLGLARRCRTARRPSGRPTGSPPPRSGARHPSGNGAGTVTTMWRLMEGGVDRIAPHGPSRCAPPSVSRGRSSSVKTSRSPCGSRQSGVLLPLRGSSSCVTGDPAASDSTQSPPERRDCRERGFPGSTRARGHPVGQRLAYGRILAPPPVTAKLPAGRSTEDHAGRIVDHDGAALGRDDGVRGVEHTTARRFCGEAENRGSEGARPPASLSWGHAECGHGEYAGFPAITSREPALRSPPKTVPRDRPEHRRCAGGASLRALRGTRSTDIPCLLSLGPRMGC